MPAVQKTIMSVSRIKKISLITAMAFGLTACEGDGVNEGLGTLIGAGLGAWLGAEIDGGRNRGTGMMMGYMAGAMIGNNIGKKMDKADRILADRAYHQSMEKSRSGKRTEWYNPDSGHRGYYIPETAVKDEISGQYCREFTQVVMIGGKEETAYGRACRKEDGSWKIISDD